jgi:hypothetical protein
LIRRNGDGLAELLIVRIADRHGDGEAVHGPAGDDHNELPLRYIRRKGRSVQEGHAEAGAEGA